MSDRVLIVLFWIHATGWLADWAYWIAVGWVFDGGVDYVGPVLLGWAAALFWPLHAVTEIWRWVLL